MIIDRFLGSEQVPNYINQTGSSENKETHSADLQTRRINEWMKELRNEAGFDSPEPLVSGQTSDPDNSRLTLASLTASQVLDSLNSC